MKSHPLRLIVALFREESIDIARASVAV